MTFTFNRSYHDIEQVAEHLPAFEAVLAELTAAGQYRYNDLFKGRIPGIAGDDEDTAIYLLQHLERARRQGEEVAELLAQGYVHVDRIDAETRFRHVIFYSDPYRSFCGEWQEWRDARLVPEHRERQHDITGRIYGVLPKGKRTHGFACNGRLVLVLP